MGVTNTASSSPTGSSSYTLAFPGAVTVGDTLICVVRTGSTINLNTLSDTVNGNWVIGTAVDNGAGRQYTGYFTATGAGTPTVTIGFDALTNPRVIIGEVANAQNPGFDVQASNVGTGTALTSGATATTAQANETAVGSFSAASNETFTQNGSWLIAAVEPAAGTSRLVMVYQDLAATGTPNAAVDDGVSAAWIGEIRTYRISGGAPATATPFVGLTMTGAGI